MDERPIAVPRPARPPAPANLASGNGAPVAPQNGTAARKAPAGAKDERHHDEGSIKETVEQILVAFILAFIFRAFVVEAFVIPTGSMAPTLLGAHTRYTCPDCGYEFDVNFNAKSSGDDLNIPNRVSRKEGYDTSQVRAVCPNCGYQLRNSEPGDPGWEPLVRYGDRILVLKYLYLFQEPRRWDVVVFKSPDSPQRWDYQLNYIKRLIGKPGEAIMILDGDIYAGEKDATPEQLKIQTKPREVQQALWRIIYDNDYQPHGLPRASYTGSDPTWRLPWRKRDGSQGWDLGDPQAASRAREFRFHNDSGAGEISFDPTLNLAARARTNAFDDWLAYDVESGRQRPTDWNLVGDLKLDFFYQRMSGDGPLRLVLSKRGQRFIAEITRGSAQLLSADGSGAETQLIAATPFDDRSGAPMHVEFSNVDYRVSLRIDDKEVFATNEAQYHPDVAALLEWHKRPDKAAPPPGASIVASSQDCTVSHLSLWRDVYYLDHLAGQPQFAASPERVMRLNADEYFVLGDNSQISGDGRYWSDPTSLPYEELFADPGKVPARFMLGKAFFVYWPAGYRPMESLPALAPNFGDMRFIH